MARDTGTLQLIAEHFARAIEPLGEAVADLDSFQDFLRKLGWEVQSLPPSYANLATLVNQIIAKLETLASSPEPAEVLDLLDRVGGLYTAIKDLTEVPDGVDPATFVAEIGERLFEFLLIEYLSREAHAVHSALEMLDVIVREDFEETAERPAFVRNHFRFGEIPKVISDPLSIPQRVYGWGTADFDFTLLAQHLFEFLAAHDQLVAIESFNPVLDAIFRGEPTSGLQETDSPLELRLTFFETVVADQPFELGLVAFKKESSGPTPPGIAIQPFVPEQIVDEIKIDDVFTLRLRAGSDVASKFQILIHPGDVVVHFPFQPGTELPSAGFGASLEYTTDTPTILLGSATSTRLQFLGWAASLGLNHSDGEIELRLGFALNGLVLVLASREQDSFLKKLLGKNDATIPIPLEIIWSSKTGIGFSGGAGFESSHALHKEIGPVTITQAQIGLRAKVESGAAPRLIAEAALSFGGQLGPLAFSVADIGVRLTSVFGDGNAGPFDIAVGFKPPNAIGLSIDGGGFKGGGFIGFEPEEALYSGMLELEFQDLFTLKAFALLNTRLPNGQSGFSLLIIISAEFTPIQLGLGFKLNGVGGLLGLNRTINIEPLRAGLRANTLSSILFPTDIVANADRIISDLKQIFPPLEGRFIFGPMAKIAWGTPTLVTIDLGLVIEIPDPVRLAILGVLRAVLPDEKAAILQVQVNFLGEINFERRQLKFDASLFDSKLLGFSLSGDMAIRLDWGADANFLLTVGGFHPSYEPPPMDLPAIRRLTLALLNGDNPRLRLEMYFAVTSNTAQFGAKLELYASASKFNVYGFLTFDVLFQFNPFHFIAELTAMLALRIGSSSFASVKLTLTLEGPTPWRAKGTASFKICWFFTLKVRFNKTFGEERHTTLPDLAVLPLLAEALRADDNWEGELPAQRHRLESIREAPELTNQLLLHPVGTLKISQKVVPLNVRIDRIGSQRPSDGREFRIVDPQPSGTTAKPQEAFAPAQFFDLTDEQKLTSASFKDLDSGVRVGDAVQLHTGYAAAREVQYEVKYIDSQRDQRLSRGGKNVFDVDAGAFNTWTLNGAIAQSELSFARKRKSSLAPEAVVVVQEQFAIVNSGDLKLFDEFSLLGSEHAAAARVDELIQTDPTLRGRLQVVPAFELAA